jgi:coatomer protein complex subunit gamma
MKLAAMANEKKKPGVPGVPAGKTEQAVEPEAAAEAKASSNAELMRIVGEIAGGSIGPLQHSCKPKSLTENEAEYTVECTKHMFKDYIALEMYVSNTVAGIDLEKIEVRLTGLEPAWVEVGATAIDKLSNGQQGSAYVLLQKASTDDEAGVVTASFGAALHFTVKEDGDDLGYDDDYPVENVVITTGDYMFPKGLTQFKSVWEQLAAQGVEVAERITLNFKTLEAAVDYIIQTLNMEPCDKTGRVEADGRGHTILLSGTFVGGHMAVVKALVGLAPQQGCVAARISCRSKSNAVCTAVTRALM